MNTKSSMNNALFAVLALANFVPTLAQTVYCTGEGCWRQWNCSDVCYTYRYGYYCCNDYWAGSGWAIALWVILVLLMIVCCVWCCVAAAADPRPVYAEPAVEVISIKTRASTQPQAVSGTAGQATVAEAGTYKVNSVQPSAPCQEGAAVSMVAPAAAPAQGQPVNVTVNTGPTEMSSSALYPDAQAPAQTMPVNTPQRTSSTGYMQRQGSTGFVAASHRGVMPQTNYQQPQVAYPTAVSPKQVQM